MDGSVFHLDKACWPTALSYSGAWSAPFLIASFVSDPGAGLCQRHQRPGAKLYPGQLTVDPSQKIPGRPALPDPKRQARPVGVCVVDSSVWSYPGNFLGNFGQVTRSYTAIWVVMRNSCKHLFYEFGDLLRFVSAHQGTVNH